MCHPDATHPLGSCDETARAKPDAVAEFYRLLEEGKRAAGLPKAGQIDAIPFGRGANRPCLELLTTYATQQGLLPRPVTIDELW